MAKKTLGKFVGGLILCLIVTFVLGKISDKIEQPQVKENVTEKATTTQGKANKKTTQDRLSTSKTGKKTVMRRPINWRKSSETVAYPDLQKVTNFWIHVSTEKSRVYLMAGSRKIYTMYASTGSGGEEATPKGTWHIQPEKGDFFYNGNSGEGAKYWVSFKDHGVYLFHSVPTDQNGNFIKSEAQDLGKKARSHGCVRLSVADAKWMYENLTTNTKVVID